MGKVDYSKVANVNLILFKLSRHFTSTSPKLMTQITNPQLHHATPSSKKEETEMTKPQASQQISTKNRWLKSLEPTLMAR